MQARGPRPEDREEFGDCFLAAPDLFPGRDSGEQWGERGATIDFAGGPYHFRGLSSEQERRVRERYRQFLSPQPGPPRDGTMVRYFRVRDSDFLDFDESRWEMWIDFSYETRVVRMAGRGFMGRIEWTPAISAAVWTSYGIDEEFLGVFANVFRVLLAYRVLEIGGALLHSAAVVDDGEAYVFVGHSGAGKTTLSRMSHAAGAQILSDDLNAVRLDGARILVDKVPFAGDFGHGDGGAGAWPLRRLLRLAQGRPEQIEPLTGARALATLISCVPFVNRDPLRRPLLLESLEGLLDRVRMSELTFSLEGHVWPLLRGESE